MAIKQYVQPRPAPKHPVPPHTHIDPAAKPAPAKELHMDGPTLEQWTDAGYDPARYPGEDAFLRDRSAIKVGEPEIHVDVETEHHDS